MRYMSDRVRNAMRKLAFVPLAPAAQDAMAQGGDPNAMGGMPMPPGGDPAAMGGAPMDPNMQGGGMPMPPGGGAPIQTVPGPNGEPIDPETGFIVVDPQQGIEQDPMTGILFFKFTGEFATPDGQPMDPQQAQQAIEQAMAQGGMPPQGGAPMDPSMMGGDPSMQGGMPPMDPSMMGGAPMDPAMMGGDPNAMGGMPMPPQGEDPNAAPPAEDPAAAQQPTIDEQTGLPLDPETGYYASPGAPTGDAESGEMIPGLEQFMAKSDKVNDRQDKAIKRMTSEMVGTRTEIQGLRRDIQQINDNQDTALARMENMLAMLESIISSQQAGVSTQNPPLGE